MFSSVVSAGPLKWSFRSKLAAGPADNKVISAQMRAGLACCHVEDTEERHSIAGRAVGGGF